MPATPVTDAEWGEEVVKSDRPVLVDFWAEWCGPCRQVSPVVDEIAEERDDLKVVKLDIDSNPRTAQQYGVMSIPTLLILRDGEEVGRLVGARGKQQLIDALDSALAG